MFRPILKGGRVLVAALTDRSVETVIKTHAGRAGLAVQRPQPAWCRRSRHRTANPGFRHAQVIVSLPSPAIVRRI
jgi:hypothetical protein